MIPTVARQYIIRDERREVRLLSVMELEEVKLSDEELKREHTTTEAAALLDMRRHSVNRAIRQGRLTAREETAPVGQTGFYFMIKREEIERYRREPKAKGGGRPRKQD